MTRYEQGFIQKCAEYGIDGRVLLEKKAGPITSLLSSAIGKGVNSLAIASLGKPMLSGIRHKATAKWLTRLLSNNAGQLDDQAIKYIAQRTKISPDKIMNLAPKLKGIKGLDTHDPVRGALNALGGDELRELLGHRTPYYFKR